VAADNANCATDGTMSVCVVSAAIAVADNPVFVDVSITLQITDKTGDPLSMLISDDMSFTPENAPSMTPANLAYIHVSGMVACSNACVNDPSPRYTTFSPGRPLLVQIRFPASVSDNSRRLLQSATVASFTATLREDDGQGQRLIPLPSSQFKFGKGLAKH